MLETRALVLMLEATRLQLRAQTEIKLATLGVVRNDLHQETLTKSDYAAAEALALVKPDVRGQQC